MNAIRYLRGLLSVRLQNLEDKCDQPHGVRSTINLGIVAL